MELQKAVEITNQSNMFYYKDEEVDGRIFRIFNYLFATYNEFKKYNAHELRGLTFDLKTGKRFWSIHKFFNLNESEELSIENIRKKYQTFYTREKIDGSLITPFFLEGVLYVKSKSSFFSEQASISKKFIIEHSNYYKMIKELNENGLQPIFELISPKNQIVIFYPETQLICIQIRELSTGKYLPNFENYCNEYSIPYPKTNIYSLDKLINLQKEAEGIEGWVGVTPDMKLFLKFKTEWYLKRHDLISPNALTENRILALVLENQIDDVISYLSSQSETRKELELYRYTISSFLSSLTQELINIIEKEKELSRKEFAIKYNKHEYFYILMKHFESTEGIEQTIRQYLLKKYNKREKAKELLNSLQERYL